MLDPPRCTVILKEAGRSDADIARGGNVVQATVINLTKHPNRNFRFDARKLYFATCKESRFPWVAAANPQLFAMAREARGSSPATVTDLFSHTGRAWVQAVEAASGNDTLNEAEWTDLSLATVYSNAEVQVARKEMRSREHDEADAARWSAVRSRYTLVSAEMLKRLDQVDTSRAADAAWVDLLRYDVTVNRMVVAWELGDKDAQAVADLGKTVEDVDFFEIFKRFNERVPNCYLAPYNALGFASALGREDLYEDLWIGKLVAAKPDYRSYLNIQNDSDTGPEFSNFLAWAVSYGTEGDVA